MPGSHLWQETLGPWCPLHQQAVGIIKSWINKKRWNNCFLLFLLSSLWRSTVFPFISWAGGDIADGMTVANTLLNHLKKKKITWSNIVFVIWLNKSSSQDCYQWLPRDRPPCCERDSKTAESTDFGADWNQWRLYVVDILFFCGQFNVLNSVNSANSL